MTDDLRSLVAAELAEPVEPRAAMLAAAVAALYPQAARAVLFYGSCLREKRLDGLMLDFYLIVSDYRAAYGKGWMATANRLIPPNVFPFEAGGLTCKYAVLSEADFARACSLGARDTSVWARFAQPSRLVWSADEQARNSAIDAIVRAAPTLIALTEPTMAEEDFADPLDVWRAGFALTYGAELRAERSHPVRLASSMPIPIATGVSRQRRGRSSARRRRPPPSNGTARATPGAARSVAASD